MKLKAIFIIFNVLIAVSFLFVFLMPVFFLGWEYAGTFWSANWYLALLFVLVLGLLNAYFIRNWRLFGALEGEDWSAVIEVLEARIRKGSWFTSGDVRLLVNAYVVTGRPEGIVALESDLKTRKPALRKKNALILGIPHLLSNDGTRIAAYFGEFAGQSGVSDAEWLRWSHGFGLMLEGKNDEAREIFHSLIDDERDPIIRALSAYLLEAYAGSDPAERERIDRCKEQITSEKAGNEWDRIVEKAREDLYVLILTKLLRDVRVWLYGERDETTTVS
ncbi:MAG: hypothetical protein ACLFR8_12445 [Alkalispirochaeta sp.]